MNSLSPRIDMIIFIFSSLILLIYVFKLFQKNNNRSDDDENGGDGGQLIPPPEPILDLPPGVTLPVNSPEPEPA